MNTNPMLRSQLISIIDDIQNANDLGQSCSEYFEQADALMPQNIVRNFVGSDMDSETIADVCIGIESARQPCSRDDLLEVVRRLGRPRATEAESILLVEKFKYNCKHPASSDLIFYPDEHFSGDNDPTVEMIVDKAIRGH